MDVGRIEECSGVATAVPVNVVRFQKLIAQTTANRRLGVRCQSVKNHYNGGSYSTHYERESMSSILELLSDQLSGDNLSMISKEIGADEASTVKGIGAALPSLLGSLSKNAETESGAQRILGALDKDHDGSILDDLGGFLGQKKYDEPRGGAGILGHILGGNEGRVQQNVSRASGLSNDSAGALMKMLAPMLMGALGKQKKNEGMGLGDLMGFLGKEKESVQQQGGSFLGRMLDQDGDGDFDMGDMAKMALGKLFGGR